MHRFVKRGRVRDSHTVIYQIIISDSKSYLAFLKISTLMCRLNVHARFFGTLEYVQLLEYESYFFFVNVQLYLLTQMPSLNRA